MASLVSRRDFLQATVETLKKILAGSESTGLVFGVENHGGTSNDPEFLDALFAGVGSPRLGLTLDTGNFYWFVSKRASTNPQTNEGGL